MNKNITRVASLLLAFLCLSPHAFALGSKPIDPLRQRAEQGDIEAQVDLGLNYCKGTGGVIKDYKKGFRWLSVAAEKGHSDAQCNLGLLYFNGHGVKKNTAEATAWYRKAANQGNAIGQYRLGISLHNGYGVAKDEVEAVKWFRKAAEQGCPPAHCCPVIS